MELCVNLPVALRDESQFKDLKIALGDEARALFVWFSVFRELLYRGKQGYPAGRLSKVDHLPGLLADVRDSLPDADAFHSVLVDRVKLLQEAEGDYLCTAFLKNNAFAHTSRESKGAYTKNFLQRQKNLDSDSLLTGMKIAANKWLDENQQPLDKGMIDRVTRLIISCDNALNQPDRMPILYTSSLIQMALGVVRECESSQIELVCRTLAGHRKHPRVQELTTEKLLPMFGRVLQELE